MGGGPPGSSCVLTDLYQANPRLVRIGQFMPPGAATARRARPPGAATARRRCARARKTGRCARIGKHAAKKEHMCTSGVARGPLYEEEIARSARIGMRATRARSCTSAQFWRAISRFVHFGQFLATGGLAAAMATPTPGVVPGIASTRRGATPAFKPQAAPAPACWLAALCSLQARRPRVRPAPGRVSLTRFFCQPYNTQDELVTLRTS